MTDTPKPPMTVWLSELDMSWQVAERRQSGLCKIGPYIHIDQFIEEVERRASRNPKTRSWDMSLGEAKAEALQELANELNEQG